MQTRKQIFLLVLLLLAGLLLCLGAAAEGGDATVEISLSAAPQTTEAPQPTEVPQTETEEEPPLVSGSDVLQYGDQSELVLALQQRLSDLGYYSGKVTGNYLGGTRSGVRSFQQDYGLTVTGKVDAATAAALQQAQYRALAYGDDGGDVTRLQEALHTLGYLSQKPTGKFRGATQTAVERFQLNNSLPATGKADLETLHVLYSEDALNKDGRPLSEDGEDLGDINDMVIAGDGEAVSSPYARSLKRGDKGAAVKQVQTRLKELGFFNGPISGNYMDQTIAAVKAFQTHNGRHETDVMDEDTWNLLFNAENVLDASCTPAPTPEPTPIPYAITVDVRNQVTTVYGLDEHGEHTVPVRYMICSTGKVGSDSDVGQFVLSGRRARWCYFPKWGSNAQYWTKINDSIAFHSVIYNERNEKYVLSTKSYNLLGSRASHGCIRLLVADAKWIYENIGEGVVVTIDDKLPASQELKKAAKKPRLNSARTGPVETPAPTPFPIYRSDALPPMPFETLTEGTESEAVFWLQSRLKDLGYYSGPVTGGYYGDTKKAVKAYQKEHGLSGSGKCTVETLESLYANVLQAAAPTQTPAPSGDAVQTPAPTETPAP